MIRKRKSKITEQEEVKENKQNELMEGAYLFNKKDSSIKSMEEIFVEGECQDIKYTESKKLNKHVNTLSTSNNNNNNDAENKNGKERKDKNIENVENPLTVSLTNSEQNEHINDLKNETNGNYKNSEIIFKGIDEICDKYDKEVQNLLENFEFLSFSRLFKNPFDATISRDEKIVRIFYYSGFSFLPYLGWVIASIYGSFCKRKNDKNIISLRIISSIQCAFFGLIIILLLAVMNMNNRSTLQCKYEGVSFKKKLVKDAKYNVVFFGPMSTDDWMKSKLAKIAEDLQFNIYTVSYPNIKNHIIKRKKNTFLKDALACAKLKYSKVILFSFQIQSALDFVIPFLEKSEILGFLSFLKKFPKNTPSVENKGKENIIYFAPMEKNIYDIYSSITLRMCQNEHKKYYNILYIVQHSFNKYRIRCAKNLAEDYSIIVNNFNFNTIGVEEKESKYDDDDFNEVTDDFYQYLAFVRDIISQKNLEFYRKMLCKNTLCESKGSVCVL
ncbi:conserved Plasmodium protein, unknown function [Plasmodium malariae]|uniref:Uncharacterized protein n=1 Tax=Plasmodium malariae TaxID=5858 RepID=A0A1D3SPU2_PLAMA|nr:conserved Plasmodium protein, unknown function [Plasmodium malariae]SCO93916.1 conserved Plasmodium protein, unknown function [Plasmodium malariae]